MKTKLLCFSLVLLATGGSLFAQIGNISNPLVGNLNVQDAGTCTTTGSIIQQLPPNASTTTLTLAGTFTATITVRTSNNGTNWTTANTLSAVGTTSYSTNGLSHLCVDVTAYTSGVVQVTILTGLLQVQSVVSGSGSGSTAPNQNVQYLATACSGQSNCTVVKWDAGTSYLGDGTTTNGSSIVTCPECKFLTGKIGSTTPPAVANQIFFATDSTGAVAGANTCQNNPSILFGGLAQTTISTVDSEIQLHVVGNSGTTSTANACFAWGDDDTAAINTAWAAGGCTTALKMPQGMAMISAPIWQKNTGCVYNNAGPYFGQRVEGSSLGGTNLIPTPNFNFASIIGGSGTASACTTCTAAIGNYLIFDYRDFGIFGLGERCSAMASTDLFLAGTAARLTNVNGVGWCGQGGGASLIGFHFLGDEDLWDQSGANFFGSIQSAVDARFVTFKGDFTTGMTSNTAGVAKCGLLVGNSQTGSSLYTQDNITAVCVQLGNSGGTTSGNMISINSQILGNANGTPDGACLFVGNNSSANFTSNDQDCTNPKVNETAVNFFSTGGFLRPSMTTFTANGTAFVITGAANNTVEDQHDNAYAGGAGRWNGLGRWVSDGSIVGFAAPTISSGFGTSPAILKESGATSFTVNVGTGGVATAGVIGLPAANAGWTCAVYNQTAHASNRADDTVQTANTTTTVTFQNQTKSTGAAVAWTASDTLNASCRAN